MCNKKHTLESLKKEAKKYKTRSEFQTKNGGAYTTALRNGWLDQICGHMLNGLIGAGRIHTPESCKKEALKYKTRMEFKNQNSGAYTTALRNGWLDQICGHMINGRIGLGQIHTLESLRKEAKKYKTRNEFFIKNGGAYTTARRNGWLDVICIHMISGRIGVGQIHTLESLRKEAKKYTTRNEFQTKKSGAYTTAFRRGWLDQICGHMVFTINLREKRLQNKIYKKLKKQYKNLDIRTEVKIPKRDNLPGRIDFIIKNPESGKFIGLELKHSESKWSKNACNIQLSKYNRAFRERKGFKGAFLISDNGSIGKSIDIIPKLIKKIL